MCIKETQEVDVSSINVKCTLRIVVLPLTGSQISLTVLYFIPNVIGQQAY
jgi:hypothetical protein